MLHTSAATRLSERMNGAVLRPGESGYDQRRAVWNGMIDRHPAVIAQCVNTGDVVAAVRFAREHDLRVSVKGGGHGVSGSAVCEGGLMIDLSPMHDVSVDQRARRARVGGGATWAAVDHAMQAHGLATTGGIVSSTGVGGLALGGGVGYLARKHGLTVDNIRAAEIVLANGDVASASEHEHPDLFWALRGGGGNFGVVTSFEFELHEVGPAVLSVQAFYPLEQAVELLRYYRELLSEAPDPFFGVAAIANVPPAAPFPDRYHGRPAAVLVAAYAGALEEGEKLLAGLDRLGPAILKALQPLPYTALQKSLDAGNPKGARYYWKSQYMDALPDEAILTVVDRAQRLPGPLTMVSFESMGGSINRIDPSATAFPHRRAAAGFGVWSGWTDPASDDDQIAWTRQVHRAMEPYSTGAVYANYLDQDDSGRVEAAFGPNYARLQRIKSTYDPDNFFRLNQNISPGP